MKFNKIKIMDLIFYFFICLFSFSTIINIKLGNMDEIWSFLFVKNMINGLLPYKEFNVIVTPFSMFFNCIFLRINPNLITFRIVYFGYYLVLIFILNKIFNKLKINRFLKYLLIFIIIESLLTFCYFDYNFIQLIFILFLIYLTLINNNYQNKTFNVIIPLIAGLTFINKQSTGIIICLITILLLFINKNNNLKLIIIYILIMLIPSILFFIYLLLSNSIFEFYDLCILGLFTFSNRLVIPFCLVLIIINYTVMILLLHKNMNKELIIIFWYAIASLAVIIPLVDFTHTTLALIVVIIFLACILNQKINIQNDNYNYLLIALITFLSVTNINSYFHISKFKTGVYKNIPVDTKYKNNIYKVSNYVLNKSKENNVIIMDFSASVYNLNIDKYNKYFDLFNNGNFGINGKREMYSIINQKKQIVLINNQEEHWQSPKDIINYVKKTYDKCGSIDQFDIYCD